MLFKIFKIFKKIWLFYIIISLFVKNSTLSCDVNELASAGFKITGLYFNESDPLDKSTSGDLVETYLNNIKTIKQIEISCRPGYKSDRGVVSQIIKCDNTTRKWSELQMECSIDCVNYPTTFELIPKENLKFPSAYAEFIRKQKIDGKINEYPGIIANEATILSKHLKDNKEKEEDFFIRIYTNPDEFIDKNIFEVKISNCIYNDNEENVCYYPFENFVELNNITKAACKESLADRPTDELNRYYFDSYFQPLEYSVLFPHTLAIVPTANDDLVELKCFHGENFPIKFFQTKCNSDEVTAFTKKCKIGYKNEKLTTEYGSFAIGMWKKLKEIGKDENCKKICGTIDSNIVMNERQLSFQSHETEIKDAPWHAGVYANNTDFSNSFEQICGGSIIHTDIVISAAHCFWDKAYGKLYHYSNYLIGVGKTYRSYDATEKYQYFAGVSKIHITTNYQDVLTYHDVAIVILNQHLTFSSYIKPICIKWEEYRDYNFKSLDGFLVGWGAQSMNDFSSTKLMRINLTTISSTECKRKVEPNSRSSITNDRFCAINEEHSAACEGDSGGGFFVKIKDDDDIERYYLTGITSIGLNYKKYCSKGFISLFQNIQYYQDFIKNVISIHRMIKEDDPNNLFRRWKSI